jgi:hypothetical protein
MRTAAVALAVMMSTASAAHAFPTLHLAARVAEQHTNVEKDDGAPAGWGTRWELGVGVNATGWLSIWGVVATSSYSDSGLYDGIARVQYGIHVTDSWTGVRVLFHPHPAMFLGVGYMAISTTEDTDRPGGPGTFDNTSWELVGGADLVHTRFGTVQAAITFGNYDRFSNLEHVHFASIGAGVQF